MEAMSDRRGSAVSDNSKLQHSLGTNFGLQLDICPVVHVCMCKFIIIMLVSIYHCTSKYCKKNSVTFIQWMLLMYVCLNLCEKTDNTH